MRSIFYTSFACLAWLCATQEIATDPGKSGPPLEIAHLYFDQWPTGELRHWGRRELNVDYWSKGIAVSSTGRLFSNYPPGLDPNNTNDGSNSKYTVAEIFPDNTERPYPSVEYNSPPGGAINYTTSPPSKS